MFLYFTILGRTNEENILREPVIKVDQYKQIRKRIEIDNINIQKVCAKYLGSRDPWLPVKYRLGVKYYHLDKVKKLGWCVNLKVSISIMIASEFYITVKR